MRRTLYSPAFQLAPDSDAVAIDALDGVIPAQSSAGMTTAHFATLVADLCARISGPDVISTRVRCACETAKLILPDALSISVEVAVNGVEYCESSGHAGIDVSPAVTAHIPIEVAGQRAGSYEIVTPAHISEVDQTMLDALARAVGAAVTAYVRVSVAEAAVQQLRDAMARRAPIEQAKGMLMAMHQIDEAEAFAMLVTQSQHQNKKLLDVSREMIQTLVEK